jgi:hypothetical protein
VIIGVDATRPQKNMAELINVQYFGALELDEEDYMGVLITPMDFSAVGNRGIYMLHGYSWKPGRWIGQNLWWVSVLN